MLGKTDSSHSWSMRVQCTQYETVSRRVDNTHTKCQRQSSLLPMRTNQEAINHPILQHRQHKKRHQKKHLNMKEQVMELLF